jgi:hypothetical protein
VNHNKEHIDYYKGTQQLFVSVSQIKNHRRKATADDGLFNDL